MPPAGVWGRSPQQAEVRAVGTGSERRRATRAEGTYFSLSYIVKRMSVHLLSSWLIMTKQKRGPPRPKKEATVLPLAWKGNQVPAPTLTVLSSLKKAAKSD